MSDWKKIDKSSYNLSVGKYSDWAPSHPFIIPYQGPKIRYSEGDELSSVADPVFNVEFTGAPLSGQHFPCGYWHKNYIPPQTIVYTSCIYPLEFTDSFKGTDITILEGLFKTINVHVDYEDAFECLSIDVVNGVFQSRVWRYAYSESFKCLTLDIISGSFVDIVVKYEIPEESFKHIDFDIVSGVFDDITIRYIYWPSEGFECTSFNIISGEFYAY